VLSHDAGEREKREKITSCFLLRLRASEVVREAMRGRLGA
jgi:hypothetical protein